MSGDLFGKSFVLMEQVEQALKPVIEDAMACGIIAHAVVSSCQGWRGRFGNLHDQVERAVLVLNEAMGGKQDGVLMLRPEGTAITVEAMRATIASVLDSRP